jgi:hypothetical protein
MAMDIVLICPTAKAKYLCERGWTRTFQKLASDLPVGQKRLIQNQFTGIPA